MYTATSSKSPWESHIASMLPFHSPNIFNRPDCSEETLCMTVLELQSDGQEAIVPQFADGLVSWNENGTPTKGHMCCVLGTRGRRRSALRVRYCRFKILMDIAQFDFIEDEKQSWGQGSLNAGTMNFITKKQKTTTKKDWCYNKKYINHSQSPWSENGTQAFTFTIKSDRHMACVCSKGPKPCVQWSEYKQYSLLASNKPKDMRKGLRTDRVHVNLALWTGFHLKY